MVVSAEVDMLRSAKDLENCAIRATDGLIGHVKDLYFDDQAWGIRYLVVETGAWLSSRKVLISPIAIGQPDWTGKILPVSITKEQVKNSPDIDTDKPVSRQHERQYLDYYQYPFYWAGEGLFAQGGYPGSTLVGLSSRDFDADYREARAQDDRAAAQAERREDVDPHLRSAKAIMDYHIEATDGGIGHVRDLLLDEGTWAIRYLIVNTSAWWFGHQVLIAPQWIQDMSWLNTTMSVKLTRQAVKDSPAYDPATPLSRDYEVNLYRHHRRSGYWADEVKTANPESGATGPSSQGAAQVRNEATRPRT
jgi:hypothetical protein